MPRKLDDLKAAAGFPALAMYGAVFQVQGKGQVFLVGKNPTLIGQDDGGQGVVSFIRDENALHSSGAFVDIVGLQDDACAFVVENLGLNTEAGATAA